MFATVFITLIPHLLIDSLLTPIVESTYLNRDMCKFESSQKDKADGSRLIPRKHTETLVLLSVRVTHGLLHITFLSPNTWPLNLNPAFHATHNSLLRKRNECFKKRGIILSTPLFFTETRSPSLLLYVLLPWHSLPNVSGDSFDWDQSYLDVYLFYEDIHDRL